MPRFRLGGGGGGSGGGAGLALGPEWNEFTSIAARDNYATANADWLAEYDANPAFLIEVTISGTSTRYRRNNSAWEVVTNVIKGGKGDKGDRGATPAARGDYVAKISIPAGTYDGDTTFGDWEIQSPAPLWETPFDSEFGDDFKGYHATNPNVANFTDGEFIYNSTDEQWRILASGAWTDDTLPNILNDTTVIDLGVQTSQTAAESALSAALASSEVTLIQDANLRDFFDDYNDDTDAPFDLSRLATIPGGRSTVLRLEFASAAFNFNNTDFIMTGTLNGRYSAQFLSITEGTNTYTTSSRFDEITELRLNSLLPISGTVTITAVLEAITEQSLRQVAYFDNAYQILRSSQASNDVYAFDTLVFENNIEKAVLMLPQTGVSDTQTGFIFDLVKNDVIVATYTHGFVPQPLGESRLFTFIDDKNNFTFTFLFVYPTGSYSRYAVENQFLLRANARTQTLVLDPTDTLEVRVYLAN